MSGSVCSDSNKSLSKAKITMSSKLELRRAPRVVAVARNYAERFAPLPSSRKGAFLEQLAALLPEVINLDIVLRELVAQHGPILS